MTGHKGRVHLSQAITPHTPNLFCMFPVIFSEMIGSVRKINNLPGIKLVSRQKNRMK